MTEDEHKKVAADAIFKAEVAELMEKRTWYVEARVGSENHRGECVRFIDDRRGGDGKYLNKRAEERIAELLVEVEMWKRRARSHGCDVDDGDPDCG